MPNQPAPPNPAVAPRFPAGRPCRRAGELRRLAHRANEEGDLLCTSRMVLADAVCVGYVEQIIKYARLSGVDFSRCSLSLRCQPFERLARRHRLLSWMLPEVTS